MTQRILQGIRRMKYLQPITTTAVFIAMTLPAASEPFALSGGSITAYRTDYDDGVFDGDVFRLTGIAGFQFGNGFGLDAGVGYASENYDGADFGTYRSFSLHPNYSFENATIGLYYQNVDMSQVAGGLDAYGVEGRYVWRDLTLQGYFGQVRSDSLYGDGNAVGLGVRYDVSDWASLFVRYQNDDMDIGDLRTYTGGANIAVGRLFNTYPFYLTIEASDTQYFASDGKNVAISLTVPFGRDRSVASVPLFKGQRTYVTEYGPLF